MEHIVNCNKLDQQKRFQCMRKIRPYYFKLDSSNALKMKVSIAAKTLSNTVAATLEAMISNNSQLLPAEAIHTANEILVLGKHARTTAGETNHNCLAKESNNCFVYQQD